jgi:two-component system, LytTR family, response regulator
LATRHPANIAVEVRALLEGMDRALPDRLVVRNGNRHEFVSVESIDWIESANNYVQLHCGTKTHLLSETLSGLEKKLASNMFLRIHRCRIVNISRITAVHSGFDETYELEMRNGVRLTSGKQFKKAVQSLIGR